MPLSLFNYRLFMDTYLPLLHYAGLKYKMVGTKTTFKEFDKKIPLQIKFECREKLIDDPRLLRDYVKKYNTSLSIEQKHILAGFSKRVTEKFIVYKLLKDKAIFMGDENKWYVVNDLNDPFSVMLDDLPCVIRASILPFQKQIVWDGFVQPYSIIIGPGIRKSLREQYKLAKEEGRLVSTLE